MTAVAGDDIHFVHRHDNGDEFGPMDFGADHFRRMARPEDQSPIPELLEALKAFLEDTRFDVSVGGNPNAVGRMLERARAAISKAEAH